jgi:hypothetical protein
MYTVKEAFQASKDAVLVLTVIEGSLWTINLARILSADHVFCWEQRILHKKEIFHLVDSRGN